MKTVYQDYADYVVFQSLYSKKQCFFLFGEKPANQYSIITNGVNKKFFYPNAQKKKNDKIKFVTAGAFRKKAMLEPLILALDSLSHNYDFELNIVGPILSPELSIFLKRNYVIYHGSKKPNQLADILRYSDIFLHSQINDNCPNAVLEAISCGLPVVAFDSGAMSELVFFSSELLAPVSDELLQKYEDFKPALLAQKIVYLLENYEKYRALALANCQLYSMAECGKKYVEVFNRFIS
jgi:glycosyltransferase involved in cell wall biosynthesis